MGRELDEIDKGILYMLQREARNTTAQEISKTIGVSPSTVRNRIDQLESDGVIRGYHPEIDYEAANLPLRVVFVCTAPATRRGELTNEVMNVQGVVDVREMMTGRRNVHIEIVATGTTDISRISDAIHELGLEIESSELMKRRQMQPFNHFQFTELDEGTTDATGE
ncbi:Lrp/AsnC family transcriptional regulator [Natrononativus amylolyticus]|uniref:Lrp/AsnC family transcriptional regulator n=1 Tax=Natrononativus amylolyticus TaxID=2963434 RepID=UPI0020CF1E8F|nr:winged helix-turn-helix transcriptional regulator [Natrononativus amylolyticus]